jgi:tRNA threonylcarbamoyl adenosine modification protein (Sua5/YciO/YrdC/YwlC family)
MTPLRLTPDDDLGPFAHALQDGKAAVMPTDTVYGLVCAAHLEDACERTLALQGRDLSKPTSIIGASLSVVFTRVLGDLGGRSVRQAKQLLPGPVTVVLPNPTGIFPWLCGDDPTRIGVRVPELLPAIADAIDRVGVIAATSANLAGQPDPVLLDQVPGAILSEVAVAIDAGRAAAGKPSTVVDLTGPEPVILREGALSEQDVHEILARGTRWWRLKRRTPPVD